MFKNNAIVFMLLTVVFMSPQAYCQQTINSHQVSTVAGKVIGIDAEGGVINLQTSMGTMLFYISVESGLYRFTHRISSIEIGKGDAVVIQYINSSGQNNIIKLVDNNPVSS